MRPLRLSFSGMRSYTGDCGPLDFTGKNLIGILGDTGAGKSTILEAITFALYGSPSWSGRDVAPLVASDATAMTVDFTFEHEGHRWRIHRIFHRGTTPTSHLLEDLDTGETFDNAGPVNKKIESLLNMNFNSFRAAVLLPQGRFDRLLTATGSDRTELLKNIFGAQVLDTIQHRATQYRDRLTDQLGDTRLARKDLRKDPASDARAARVAAEHAETRSTQLAEALTELRNAQREAIAARDRRENLTNALTDLEGHRIDASESIGQARQAERHLTEQRAELAAHEQAMRRQLGEAKAGLDAAAARNETPHSLGSVASMLSGMPGRLADLAGQREELAEEDRRLVDFARQLTELEAELPEARATAAEHDAALATATEALSQTRDAIRVLRDACSSALGEAVAVARGLHEARAADRSVESLRQVLPELRGAVAEAKTALASADQRLETVRRDESAHLLGAQLAHGDTCPVCARPLLGDFHAPEAVDPQTLQVAEEARAARAAEYDRARNALDHADAKLLAAEETAAQRHQAADDGRSRLDEARQAAISIAHSDAWPRTKIPTWDRTAFTTALDIAISKLSEGDPDHRDRLRAQLIATLLEAVDSFEHALAQAERSARETADTADKHAEDIEISLEEGKRSHARASQQASTNKRRHTAAEEGLRGELDALPGIARNALPQDLGRVSTQDVLDAGRVVAQRLNELNELIRNRNEAQTELTEIAKQEHTLDKRHHAEVAKPLQSLLARLDRWTEAIAAAARMIGRPYTRTAVPQDPTVDAAAQYATTVTRDASDTQQALHAALTDVAAQVDNLLEKLTTRATNLQNIEGAPADSLLSCDADPLDAAFLDPVNEAATTARNDAARQRAEQADAEGQIERARMLDRAISAGEARHTAICQLCSHLTGAKFQQYLIEQRTRALLGLASDLFGQLSEGQFGFGPDFQIVSRASNTSRSPKTLSGGETFLASLALALALVELYSRTGTRLDALFLDEGFGSLDVDTLARALAVLRSETGSSKLVTVISHLHAVAEVVEDVLWVERRPAGSEARWLNDSERDALIREDVSTGLLRLT